MPETSHATAVDAAIDDFVDDAFEFLRALIAVPSELGHESGAQEVLATALESAGFRIHRLPIPSDIADHPAAGVPRRSYQDRYDLIAQRDTPTEQSPRRSLVLNGHIDVVPATTPERWSSSPFGPVVRDGWMYGRGAGDMKGGFAAGLLAIRALDAARPQWLQNGSLTVVSAIEEECTGNGTLAAGLAGFTGDAALLLEPTDLRVLLAGVGIVWVRITIDGDAGHAEAAAGIPNPLEATRVVLDALSGLERRLNDEHADDAVAASDLAALQRPFAVNVGELHAGDWPSSVPASVRIGVRVAHPQSWDAERALQAVAEAVTAASAGQEWLEEHPPRLELDGFRAQSYHQPVASPLVQALARAHHEAHGTTAQLIALGSTTDARFYINQFGVPAVAYGPRTRNIHGIDEAVELASVVDTARTVARFLLSWFGNATPENEANNVEDGDG